MAIKNGKDYLYLIWKCTSSKRQYTVSQPTRNGRYESQYGGETKDAIKIGFKPLVSFEKLGNVYKYEGSFPASPSRPPDKKRRDIKRTSEKHKLEGYGLYELLKRNDVKSSVDNLQSIGPILGFEDGFKKEFYVAGIRHYLGRKDEKCMETLPVIRGGEVFLEQEKNGQYGKNTICAVNERRKLSGYVPRYYVQTFNKFTEEKRIRECHVINVERENCCDECICTLLKTNELRS